MVLVQNKILRASINVIAPICRKHAVYGKTGNYKANYLFFKMLLKKSSYITYKIHLKMNSSFAFTGEL